MTCVGLGWVELFMVRVIACMCVHVKCVRVLVFSCICVCTCIVALMYEYTCFVYSCVVIFMYCGIVVLLYCCSVALMHGCVLCNVYCQLLHSCVNIFGCFGCSCNRVIV